MRSIIIMLAISFLSFLASKYSHNFSLDTYYQKGEEVISEFTKQISDVLNKKPSN